METSIVEKGPIFDFVYGMAVNDALNQTYDNKTGDKSALLINRRVKTCVWDYFNEILSGNKPDMIDYCKKIKCAAGKKPESLTFGKIQKLINMTMKYMYIRYYDTELGDRFINCDAPMDSVMMDLVYYYKTQTKDVCHFKKSQSWSSIDCSNVSDYKGFQEDVLSIIGPNEPKIKFDYEVWNDAKMLRKKPLKERGKEAKQIIDRFLNQ